MFKKIVVGVDEHQGGRDAITLAKHLLDVDGRLTLAHVYRAVMTGPRATGPYEPDAREHSLELLRAARDQAGVEAELVYGGANSIGRGLHGLAEAERADLLVVGSCRRGMLGRVLIADDTRASLNGAPCAVAIAPAGYATHPWPMLEIGVGYDGSPESEHALAVARELAVRHGARLSAFEAVRPPSYVSFTGETTAQPHRDPIGEARERMAALDVEPHATYGDAPEELALFGASVDLLVLGSRGYGPIGRLMHGSTSGRLARLARCPLLILTRAVRENALADVAESEREDSMTVLV